jgi:4-diphosphocytidyl-2-C-methyl-D-erythritol kinase
LIAPAKVNLALFLGPTRADGLHEICSLFAPISLADELTVSEAAGEADEVICPGMPAPDLTARALAALREAGWARSPLRIEVTKRIPVAAGLGGGSADAAAALRLAAEAFEPERLSELAAGIGADVPSQIEPRFALVGGAGEVVVPLPEPEPYAVVLLPDPEGLSTADVYAEADRLGLARGAGELEAARSRLLGAAAAGESPLGYRELLVNDLAAAAISLRPSIEAALEALREAGAEHAFVTGSGPTAVGLFADDEAAGRAASELSAAGREPTVATSRIGS